jgi:hypothetical protein
VLAFLGERGRTYLPDASAPKSTATSAQLGFGDWRSGDAASLLGRYGAEGRIDHIGM